MCIGDTNAIRTGRSLCTGVALYALCTTRSLNITQVILFAVRILQLQLSIVIHPRGIDTTTVCTIFTGSTIRAWRSVFAVRARNALRPGCSIFSRFALRSSLSIFTRSALGTRVTLWAFNVHRFRVVLPAVIGPADLPRCGHAGRISGAIHTLTNILEQCLHLGVIRLQLRWIRRVCLHSRRVIRTWAHIKHARLRAYTLHQLLTVHSIAVNAQAAHSLLQRRGETLSIHHSGKLAIHAHPHDQIGVCRIQLYHTADLIDILSCHRVFVL